MPLRRLDAEARAIIDLANDIAHEHELEYVGTEHILLAILRHKDNVAARVLSRLGVDEERGRAKVDEIVQRSKEDTWVFGRLPGTPHYRDVIERAMSIADQLEAKHIGSAHLLLALFHDDSSTAQRALTGLGVTQQACREQVLHALSAK
jgi:ATP-dependent Clp protease ATP-binding subunit ClpC